MYSPIILASKSPRRQELLRLMDIEFEVVLHDVDESFPESLAPADIALHISEKKARAFDREITDELVITADTIVVLDEQIIGKPADLKEAVVMLKQLSGRKHTVITGVSLLYKGTMISFYDTTQVTFRVFTDDEISWYVEKYRPLDKAGSYGIQEWIGLVGIEQIEGSYTNVMGLPTEKLYGHLLRMNSKFQTTDS